MTPVLFRNVLLYDGSGNAPRCADVAVKEDKIAAVGKANTFSTTGCSVIEGRGLALVPGFIDAHGHSDTLVMDTPSGDSKISQGVTTEIVGNCGFCDYLEKPDETGFTEKIRYRFNGTFEQYADMIDHAHVALNIASFCGHNSMRCRVMGYEDRKPTAGELNQMKTMLAEALEHGALGLSSGLWYFPGKLAQTGELRELAALLRGTGRIYATHMRSEGDTIEEAIDEAVQIARAGDSNLQISHFKIFYERNWHKCDAVIDKVEHYRQSGMQITADQYPYTYSSTSLRMVAPPPWDKIDNETLCNKLKASAEMRAELAEALKHQTEAPWNRILVVNTPNPALSIYYGKNMEEIAAMMQCNPREAAVRLLTDCYIGAAFGTMDESVMMRMMALPWVMAGSDGCVRSFADNGTHPRAFGFAPRFFNLASKLVPKEEVIRRMTALPAQKFHLGKRGIIAPGYFADLALLDLDRYDTDATFTEPNRAATGVVQVYVNGELAYSSAPEQKTYRAGRMLKFER